jgi:hypothetical protein
VQVDMLHREYTERNKKKWVNSQQIKTVLDTARKITPAAY